MVPSAKEFAAALRGLDLSQTDRAMLRLHYFAPDRRLASIQFSQLMGWGWQSGNAHYGKLAIRVANFFQWKPNEEDRFWEDMKVSAIVLGKRTNGVYWWTMRPEVASALEIIGLVGSLESDLLSLDFPMRTMTVEEKKHYVWHRRIERNSEASRIAKRNREPRCEACAFSFSEVYGDIGNDFIETHHLAALSSLSDGEARIYAASDFALLCSNCHRMIHRWPDPSDLSGFKATLKTRN